MIRDAVAGTGGIAGICHVSALRARAHRTEIVAADREQDLPAAAMPEPERPDLVHACTPPFARAASVRDHLAAGARADARDHGARRLPAPA